MADSESGVVSVLVHIVTWNSAEAITACLERVVAQDGYTLGIDLFVRVTDNSSGDNTVSLVEEFIAAGRYPSGSISLIRNSKNLGFCGAHNQGVAEFLESEIGACLILNPDVGLARNCLKVLANSLVGTHRIGFVTPKLLRALPSLEPIYPHVIDAAGMRLNASCRHFDRGAGTWDQGQFEQEEFVFGGTGACLLISRECVLDLVIPNSIDDSQVYNIYPQLRQGAELRAQLFDEAFFAYREDADLAWRAGIKQWNCRYQPRAIATHVRVVTPERRKKLPETLNRYSVRNRFLLQMNNWRWSNGIVFFLWGILFRNLVVVLAVLLMERSSCGALREAYMLKKRAFQIRRWLKG